MPVFADRGVNFSFFFLKIDLMEFATRAASSSPAVCLGVFVQSRAAAALKQEKPGGEGGPSESCFPAVMNRI